MNKEFLNEKDLKEVAAQFDLELKEYVDSVMKVDNQDELHKMEDELMKEQNEINDYIKDVKYTLPKEVVFDGEKRAINRIAGDIIYFLNKKEVEWQYTHGLYELVKFWQSNNPTVITYGAYDSTLRILNQIPYKGFSEWKNILAINEYLKVAHEQYSKDTSWLIFVSEKHNAVLDRMKQLSELGAELEGDQQEGKPDTTEQKIINLKPKK